MILWLVGRPLARFMHRARRSHHARATTRLHDKARAAYPAVVVDHILAYAVRGTNARALAVGAGTGKATVAFARRGLPIVALEPDEAMATVGRRNYAPFPNVRIELTTLGLARAVPVLRPGVHRPAWHWVRP